MVKLAVLGSGRGSNFHAILQAIQRGELTGCRVRVVISNNSGSGILEIARRHGIPALHMSSQIFAGDREFVDAMLKTLRSHDVDFIVLAGYMKKLDRRIIGAFRDRIINIHPALLPLHGGEGMYGMNVHKAVLAAGERFSGATVHMVDEEYDHGRIILQRQVPVEPDETPETLAAKVLAVEHVLLPEAIKLLVEGSIAVAVEETTLHHS